MCPSVTIGTLFDRQSTCYVAFSVYVPETSRRLHIYKKHGYLDIYPSLPTPNDEGRKGEGRAKKKIEYGSGREAEWNRRGRELWCQGVSESESMIYDPFFYQRRLTFENKVDPPSSSKHYALYRHLDFISSLWARKEKPKTVATLSLEQIY